MRPDSKLSSILHLLLHMAHDRRALTSEELATYLQTNPVVVRRMLAGLRERGYVRGTKGHGGGWVVAVDLHHVTLHDIYLSVGSPAMFAMGNRVENPQCLVEKVVNQSLDTAFADAEALLVSRFADVTLASLSEQFNTQYSQHGNQHDSK